MIEQSIFSLMRELAQVNRALVVIDVWQTTLRLLRLLLKPLLHSELKSFDVYFLFDDSFRLALPSLKCP